MTGAASALLLLVGAVGAPRPALAVPSARVSVSAPAPVARTPVTATPTAVGAIAATNPVPLTPTPSPASTRAILAVSVNGVAKGDLLAVVMPTDLLLRLSDLPSLGVTGLTPRVVAVAGVSYVSLRSLAPDLSYTLDQARSALTITVSPTHLQGTAIDFGPVLLPDDAVTPVSDTTGFVNYALGWERGLGLTAAAEVGLGFGQNSFNSTFSFQSGRLTRGLTALALNHPESVSRWVIGDIYTDTGTLGSTAILGGVTYQRQYSLNPFALYQPAVGLQGLVQSPATLDVYVNGRLLRSQPVAPGPLQLQNIPALTGRGTVEAVVRDAFGRRQDLAASIYKPAVGLRQGATDFSYTLGFQRPRLNDSLSGQYTSLALSARQAVGLSDSLTLGARLEATPNLVSGGLSLLWSLPGAWGQVVGSVGLSESSGWSGTALALGYNYTSPSLTFDLQAQWLSNHYSTLGLAATDDRGVFALNAALAVPVAPRVLLRPSYSRVTQRDGSTRQSLGLSLNASIGRNTVFLTASHDTLDGATDNRLSVNLILPLGREIAMLQVSDSGSQGAGASLSLDRPLSPQYQGSDLGYHLEQGVGANQLTRVAAQYQTPVGIASVDYSRLRGSTEGRVGFAGGLAFVGGKTIPTRPLYGSFALAQATVPGVRVLLNHQVVGRTGADGTLFVPNLVPSVPNRLALETTDIPLRYRIGVAERAVVPPPRSGGRVVFPVHATQVVVGRVRLRPITERGPPAGTVSLSPVPGISSAAPSLAPPNPAIPAYGQVTFVSAAGAATTSPLGANGEFYAEDLQPGPYTVRVSFEGQTYQAALTMPSSTQAKVDLGTVVVTLPSEPSATTTAVPTAGVAPAVLPTSTVPSIVPSPVPTTVVPPPAVPSTRVSTTPVPSTVPSTGVPAAVPPVVGPAVVPPVAKPGSDVTPIVKALPRILNDTVKPR